MFAHGQAAQLDILQQQFVEGRQLGRDVERDLVVGQVTSGGGMGRYEEGREEKVGQRLQLEDLQVERSVLLRVAGIFFFLVVPAEKMLQIVLVQEMGGFFGEVADEDVAVIDAPEQVAVERDGIAVVILPGIQHNVAHREDLAGQRGLQVLDPGLAEESAFGCLRDVGGEPKRNGGAVSPVEMDGVQVHMIDVQVHHIAAVLSFAAQGNVTAALQDDVRIGALDPGMDVAVLEGAGSDQAGVVISIEMNMFHRQRLDVDRHVLSLAGERDVAPAV